MNSEKITQLVKNYKKILGNCKPSMKLKEYLIKNIIFEYNLIINNLANDINIDRDEVLSLFNYNLVNCIDSYDINKNVAFNTYFFNYIKAIKRQIFKPYYNLSTEDENISSISELELNDLKIDLPKILTSEELLILDTFQKGKSDRRGSKLLTKRLSIIYNKIREYLND